MHTTNTFLFKTSVFDIYYFINSHNKGPTLKQETRTNKIHYYQNTSSSSQHGGWGFLSCFYNQWQFEKVQVSPAGWRPEWNQLWCIMLLKIQHVSALSYSSDPEKGGSAPHVKSGGRTSKGPHTHTGHFRGNWFSKTIYINTFVKRN